MFFLKDNNIQRDSYIWNMIGSLLMAFQSVIMLIILTRTLGLVEAGIFTIAYANANLFLTVGKYGMRYFQVSDVKKQFDFVEYKSSRIVTLIVMLSISIIYVSYAAHSNDYSFEKTQIIIWMCLFKAVDALEDVYSGFYQKENRLDVASKVMSIRLIFTIIIFGVNIILLNDLLLALVIATITTTLLFYLFKAWTFSYFKVKKVKTNWGNVRKLLILCFPLCAGAFLSFYIGNAPKYAIDSMLTDEAQACYGFIAMPVFVIGLLNNFIFNPMLYKMSVLWDEGKIRKFVFKTVRQSGIIAIITIVCMLGAYVLGIPVLSWLYNTDLSSYRTELLLLLLGGGFLGLSGLFNAVITIIRYQHSLMWGYAIVAILAFVFSDRVVGTYQLLGASVLYTMLMGILCLIFIVLFIVGVLNKRKNTFR